MSLCLTCSQPNARSFPGRGDHAHASSRLRRNQGVVWLGGTHLCIFCGAQVLQHLDEEGCRRVAALLKALPYESVLLVGQAHSFVTQAFDETDVVVKRDGASTIEER